MRPRRRARSLYTLLAAGLVALVVYPSPVEATVEEQRARLPPPAACPDDVEGVWVALRYEPHYNPPEWYHVTLDIHRTKDSKVKIEGTMLVHYWLGGPKDVQPPPCRPGGYDRTVLQPSTGTVINGRVQFDAQSWRQVAEPCGGSEDRRYNLDHYSGTIDPKIQEFQSVNNDGGRAVNEPAVFRRVKCFEAERRVVTDVTPPPFTPPRRASCGRGW